MSDQAVSQMPVAYSSQSGALILDNESMKSMMTLADFMAKGVSTVPKHLQKNASDCLAVVMQAVQWKMNPFAVAQKTHVVSGTLGYEAQLVNAVINSLAPTKDRINYEWFGPWERVLGKFKEVESKKKVDEDTGKPVVYRVPNWTLADEVGIGIKVWATMKGEEKPRELTLALNQCRVRNSPLWADDPRQQIAYLAVKRWSRLHCPDVIMGVYSPDELAEIAPSPERITPDPARDLRPSYPDERFAASMPNVKKNIENGSKTAADIIGMLELKWTLSQSQKDAINAIKPTETVTETQGETA